MPMLRLHSTNVTVILTNTSMLVVFHLVCFSVAMIMWWNSSMGQLADGPGQTYSINAEGQYCYDLTPSVLPKWDSHTLSCNLCHPGFF